MTLHAKRAMSDLQDYPLNLCVLFEIVYKPIETRLYSVANTENISPKTNTWPISNTEC